MRVELVYFKKNGKFYGRGVYEVEPQPLYKVWEEIEQLLEKGKRPGLNDGQSGFHVLINVPEHEHNHPHLLICAG